MIVSALTQGLPGQIGTVFVDHDNLDRCSGREATHAVIVSVTMQTASTVKIRFIIHSRFLRRPLIGSGVDGLTLEYSGQYSGLVYFGCGNLKQVVIQHNHVSKFAFFYGSRDIIVMQ